MRWEKEFLACVGCFDGENVLIGGVASAEVGVCGIGGGVLRFRRQKGGCAEGAEEGGGIGEG